VQKRRKPIRKKLDSTGTEKSHLTSVDIEHFKQMLLEKRREILHNVSEIEDEALKKSRLDAAGDLSSMPIHMADIGTDNYEQEFALGLMDSERQLLREIDDALGRVEEGAYGICEGTGKSIPKARLEAQPWARYGVEYARMIEQGLVEEEEEKETEEERE
jgi:RNA polymerase-binding protein DksA